jgi:hypothetical protein
MVAQNDLTYLYWSAFVFTMLVNCLNFYPILYKRMVMRRGAGKLRANMYIYKMIGEQKNEVVNRNGFPV